MQISRREMIGRVITGAGLLACAGTVTQTQMLVRDHGSEIDYEYEHDYLERAFDGISRGLFRSVCCKQIDDFGVVHYKVRLSHPEVVEHPGFVPHGEIRCCSVSVKDVGLLERVINAQAKWCLDNRRPEQIVGWVSENGTHRVLRADSTNDGFIYGIPYEGQVLPFHDEPTC